MDLHRNRSRGARFGKSAAIAALSLMTLATFNAAAQGCSCFSPEQRAKTAEDSLQAATLAAYARVLTVNSQGEATVNVLESYKGPAANEQVIVQRATQECPGKVLVAGEEFLLLSFKPVATACDKYPREHYLVQEFRLKLQ